MKKMLTLLLTGAMLLSLAACGDSTPVPEAGAGAPEHSAPPAKETETGDAAAPEQTWAAIENDMMKVELTRVEFGRILSNTTDDTFLLPGDYPVEGQDMNGEKILNPYVAGDGKVFLSFSYTLKNTGKKPIGTGFVWAAEADYDDGYTYVASAEDQEHPFYMWNKTTWENLSSEGHEIEALDENEYEIRGYVEVPEQVMENREKSLKLNFYLFDGDVQKLIAAAQGMNTDLEEIFDKHTIVVRA